MTDLSNRFGDGDGEKEARARTADLDRLRQPSPEPGPGANTTARWSGYLKRSSALCAVAFSIAAAGFAIWPLLHPPVVSLPPIAQTGEDVATVTVQPLWDNGVAAAPDWYGLFNAYQLETSLRDISIRCNYALPMDARVDRYLHARLDIGTAIHIYLADPGTCPHA